jgi:hypothetical protein
MLLGQANLFRDRQYLQNTIDADALAFQLRSRTLAGHSPQIFPQIPQLHSNPLLALTIKADLAKLTEQNEAMMRFLQNNMMLNMIANQMGSQNTPPTPQMTATIPAQVVRNSEQQAQFPLVRPQVVHPITAESFVTTTVKPKSNIKVVICEKEVAKSISLDEKNLKCVQTVNRKKIKKRKRKKKHNTCGHPDKPHYARNYCYNCYHRKGRNKKPWNCEHDVLYAQGLCQLCYINDYNKKKKEEGTSAADDFMSLSTVKRNEETDVSVSIQQEENDGSSNKEDIEEEDTIDDHVEMEEIL